MTTQKHAQYGPIPADLVAPFNPTVHCSPQMPGATWLADMADATLDAITMHAPDGTLERRHEIAHALRTLKPGGQLIVLAANTKGGQRLAKEVAGFGCRFERASKRHHQIITAERPSAPLGLSEAIAAGAPRSIEIAGQDWWTQPGVFSWDKRDHGTALLLEHLPELAGRGADLGCGLGFLAAAIAKGHAVRDLALIDIDIRALRLAERNMAERNMAKRAMTADAKPTDPKLTFHWRDVAAATDLPADLDFVVTNPPWHVQGQQRQSLGQSFIRKAARMLKETGELWMVANRHLAYETIVQAAFADARLVAETGGYKIVRARGAKAGAKAGP